MKKFIITILTIIAISNIAYSASRTSMPDDAAALGVQSIWNAYNERREIFEDESVNRKQARANAGKKTQYINNFIATAAVADREATRVEKNRILTTVIAGEIIARANGTETNLCYDAAIAYDANHALYGHHTALRLTQEIAKSCMEHYEFSNAFKFNEDELGKLKSLLDITGIREVTFKTLLHHAYYAHHCKTIALNNASAAFLSDHGSRGARMVAGDSETEKEKAGREILAVVDAYRAEQKKVKLPEEISAFFKKQKLEEKYKGIEPVKALASEASDFIGKISQLTVRHGGIVRTNVVATSMADFQAHAPAPQHDVQHQIKQQQGQMRIYGDLVLYDIEKLRDLVTIAVADRELIDRLNLIRKDLYVPDGFGNVRLPESLLFSLCQPVGYSTSISYSSNQSW